MPANVEDYQQHAMGSALTLMTGSTLLLIGSILLTAGAWRLLSARESRSWRPANSVIIEARLPSHCAHCWPVINYRYIVSGQSFVGDHIVAGPQDYYSPQEAQAKVEQYIVGRRLTAYYDPKNPAIACLEPGIIRWPAYLLLAIAVCCLSAASLVFWRVYRARSVPRAKTDKLATSIQER
jgi:hypothetical protein